MFLKFPTKEHEYSTCQDTISVIYGKEQTSLIKVNPCYTMKLLQQKHNHSINYFYANYINKTLKKPKTVYWLINIKDQGFFDEQEHLEKQYNSNYIQEEFPALLEYYRYYGQKPMTFHKELFNLLFSYAEKQKIVEYNRLKHILNLEQSNEGCQRVKRVNHSIKNNYSRILSNISEGESYKDQQSYLFKELNKYLYHIFGKQQEPCLKNIDRKYHFPISKTSKLTKPPNIVYQSTRKNSQNKDKKVQKADIKPLALKINEKKRFSCENPIFYGICKSQEKSLNETASKLHKKLKKRPKREKREKFASCQSIETEQTVHINDIKPLGRSKFNIHTKQNSTNQSVFKIDNQIKQAIDEIKKRINIQKKQVKNKKCNDFHGLTNKKYRVK